jgi:hypothetical protein
MEKIVEITLPSEGEAVHVEICVKQPASKNEYPTLGNRFGHQMSSVYATK